MTSPLDAARESVLDRMETNQRRLRLTIVAAAVLEAAMIALGLAWVDLQDPVQRLVFVLAMFVYLLLAMGLIALGVHVSRCTDRVLAALEGDRHA